MVWEPLHVAKGDADGPRLANGFLRVHHGAYDGILAVEVLINGCRWVVRFVERIQNFLDILWSHFVVLEFKEVKEFSGFSVSEIAVIVS